VLMNLVLKKDQDSKKAAYDYNILSDKDDLLTKVEKHIIANTVLRFEMIEPETEVSADQCWVREDTWDDCCLGSDCSKNDDSHTWLPILDKKIGKKCCKEEQHKDGKIANCVRKVLKRSNECWSTAFAEEKKGLSLMDQWKVSFSMKRIVVNENVLQSSAQLSRMEFGNNVLRRTGARTNIHVGGDNDGSKTKKKADPSFTEKELEEGIREHKDLGMKKVVVSKFKLRFRGTGTSMAFCDRFEKVSKYSRVKDDICVSKEWGESVCSNINQFENPSEYSRIRDMTDQPMLIDQHESCFEQIQTKPAPNNNGGSALMARSQILP